GDRPQRLLLQATLAGGGVDLLDRDRARLRVPAAQLLAGKGVVAANQRAELAVLDDALEAERGGAAAGPDARRPAAASVVVVDPGRDGALVVALLPRRQLRHAQHAIHCALDAF